MKRIFLGFLVFLLPVMAGNAQVRWAAEFNLGLPVNVPMPLTISQNYQPVISRFAVWSAEPFQKPYNWMWRIGRWKPGRAWEFQTMHHKMVLLNRPDEVQWFGITHGFNTLVLNRAREVGKGVVRYGLGAVLAHPENTVRDKVLNEKAGLLKTGYYLTGPVLMTSMARPLRIGKSFLINMEASVTAGLAQVPVADGTASLMHLAFHLHAGLGGSFAARNSDNPRRKDVKPRVEL